MGAESTRRNVLTSAVTPCGLVKIQMYASNVPHFPAISRNARALSTADSIFSRLRTMPGSASSDRLFCPS